MVKPFAINGVRHKFDHMIHKAISKTEVAFRYYRRIDSSVDFLLHEMKEFSRETACKVFCAQEKKGYINRKLVALVIKEIFKEQKELLKLKK